MGVPDQSATVVGESREAFRVDIQAMRGAAVSLVVAYHAWPQWVPGGYIGVDVFFVLSGFLITRLIAAEVERTGSVSLVAFYGRRVRRLLPAAAALLVGVTIISLVLLPATEWQRTARDIAASALYFQNWNLAFQAVDYLASDTQPGLLQHFWSLSVEEQFYLFWPALLLLAVLAGGRRGFLLPTTVGLVGIASLVWSWWSTASAPELSYFSTWTRVWELAAGGMLAFVRVEPKGSLRAGLRIAGALCVLYSAWVFNADTTFPGTAALLPVLGTLAILAAGDLPDSRAGKALLRPLTYAGAISYSLYLWHWPMLAIPAALRLEPATGTAAGLLCGLAAADISKRWIEDPFRRRELAKPLQVASAAAACLVPAIAAAGVLLVAVSLAGNSSASAKSLLASVMAEDAPEGSSTFTPTLLTAREDIPFVYRNGCHANESRTDPTGCVIVDQEASVVVAVVGDSHAAQWIPPLQEIATRRRWRLLAFTKSGCPFSSATTFLRDQPYVACDAWNANLLAQLVADPPDLVLLGQHVGHLVTNSHGRDDSARLFAEAIAAMSRPLQQAGSLVVALRDTPRMGFDVVDCMARAEMPLEACARTSSEAFSYPDPLVLAAATARISLVDLTDGICVGEICPPVVRGMLVYRDSNHLTATYATSLAPALERALVPLTIRP